MTRAVLKNWAAHLQTPVDAASVGVFRIVFGAMVALDAGRFLFKGWVHEYYVAPSIHFTYPLFSFVEPWPGQWMHAHFWVLMTLGLLVSLGLFYRAASVLLFFAYTYVFLLDQSLYMNHYYLIVLLSFLLMVIPAHRAFSLDRFRRRILPHTLPRWAIVILRFQLFVVYFYGGIAKLNCDWLHGEPMYSILTRGGPEVPRIASHVPPEALAYAIAYGGLVIDLAVPVLLLFRPTLAVGFLMAATFHALNAAFLRIGVFSYLMTGAITVFFAPSWPRWAFRRRPLSPQQPASPSRHGWLTLAAIHLYVLAQLLIPFRHWLYPGNVSWTEEGHRFAWHMKLRQKRCETAIRANDPATGRNWTIDPTVDLRRRQQRKLRTFPDIMLQYVHHHRERLRRQGVTDPVITVDWLCSLNGRPYQHLVDPSIDLAKVERSWRPARWILPLDPRQRDDPERSPSGPQD